MVMALLQTNAGKEQSLLLLFNLIFNGSKLVSLNQLVTGRP